MRRVMLMVVLLFPALAVAEDTSVAVSASAQGAAQQAPAARPELRRRPSMVGYIGDSTIRSHVRIRFDAGFQVMAADRAEFFYGKCGCYRGLPVGHPAYDPNAAGPGPGILTDSNFQQLYILGEYALMNRASVFAELPTRWLKPKAFAPGTGSFPDATGVSDLRFGVKASLFSSPDRQVTFQFQTAGPTGDALKGLGTGHWSVEPTLLYSEQVSDRLRIETQFGDVIPTGGSAGVPTSGTDRFSGNVLYYGVGPSYELFSTDRVRVAPVVELVGWHVLSGFQTADVADASGINIVNLKVGGRIVFRDQSSIYVGYGHALTDNVWYDDILRFEYGFSF
jgi:outer membrane putative beta-barrel porin/alpha-amylase